MGLSMVEYYSGEVELTSSDMRYSAVDIEE